MSRKNKKYRSQYKAKAAEHVPMEAFSFGDPIPVLDKREAFDYLECVQIDNYYEPPISFYGLARTFRAAPHHSSAVYVKRNILTSTFIPNQYLSRQTFDSLALDFLLFGNGYLELRDNRLGQPLSLKHSPAKFTRRGVDLETYWFVQQGYDSQPYAFQTGKVFHLIEPDINQELYGLPEYLAAIPSVLLNEASTLFRRKYYLNGSHAGYILYISDAAQKTDDIDRIREALKSSKGAGNFRNLFLYAPGGKKDGIQTIPLSEAAAKDEFLNIKNVSRDDMLAAHRVPPQIMGIIPENVGGFGDVEKAAKVFVRNELIPLQSKMKQLNDWLGFEVVKFEKYSLDLDDD
ncbi:phage portal protein, PBSX family [Providencia alcalifaciens RIMD 1656011]|uniref:phage portal protein n=1 Tax=Providencia alcalifaciens TaxID=126385 RepID=UPI0003E21D66|nr:phage portal protein [Providencia alcalifaciens]ETT00389.1 phage portal protein, PBSX family [Providencia alcalifaciens PAL-3]EUC98434.1 phage portal protein, PBSX family [Providencia alcalifaciens PAL-1]EUD04130.1 phage portal protein, PBSX family [Providencia alcalifaciens RIMD 1656011]MTC15997.1 phage portal protein [Providencia alcalifaciens]MTC16021.1 phage portal protein [Providencia alcalifaciens]